MDHYFHRYTIYETAPPTFCPDCAITPGGNEDEPKKFQKKIRVNFMGMVTDPQSANVI